MSDRQVEIQFVVTLHCTGSGIDREAMCRTIYTALESYRNEMGLSMDEDIDAVYGLSVGYVTEVV